MAGHVYGRFGGHVYGLGRISSTDGSGVQTYYDSDGLGSTADLTNSSATRTDGYTYDAFGAPTHSPGSSANPFQFTGQQTDGDSGLQYLRARYYDPTTGRFLSQDPVSGLAQVPQTQNRYPYALNNPTTFDDPTGQFCRSIGGCIKSVAGVASDVASAAAPCAFQCVTWGAAGFAFGGTAPGAVAGCVAGASSYYIDQHVNGPIGAIYQCAIGGAAVIGIATSAGNLGAAAGCVAGAATWVDEHYGANNAVDQCAFAGMAGFVAATGKIQQQAGVAGAACGAAIVSNLSRYIWSSGQDTSDLNINLFQTRSGGPKE